MKFSELKVGEFFMFKPSNLGACLKLEIDYQHQTMGRYRVLNTNIFGDSYCNFDSPVLKVETSFKVVEEPKLYFKDLELGQKFLWGNGKIDTQVKTKIKIDSNPGYIYDDIYLSFNGKTYNNYEVTLKS